MAERFAFVHVGQMHFDEWDAHREQRVTQCHAGMSKSRRVDQNKIHPFVAGGVYAVDQFILGIALQVEQMVAGIAGSLFQVLIDLRQGCCAVDARLAGAEQVQVGAVQYQQANGSLSAPRPNWTAIPLFGIVARH